MKYPTYLFIIPVLLILCSTLSCSKEEGTQGPEGKKSLMQMTTIAPGVNCSSGGTFIESGIDKNGNSKLDAEEVDDSAYVCNGSYDKQIIIKLTESNISKAPNSELIVPMLPGFNKNSFVGVDSIVLYAQPHANDIPASLSAKVELYNVTDKKVIENSEISSIVYAPDNFLSSKNCYASIPDKTIDLGIRITGAYSASTGKVFLMLYRK